MRIALIILAAMAAAAVTIVMLESCNSINHGGAYPYPDYHTINAQAGNHDAWTSAVYQDNYTIVPLALEGEYWYGTQDTAGVWEWRGPAATQVTLAATGAVQIGVIVYDGDRLTFRVQ